MENRIWHTTDIVTQKISFMHSTMSNHACTHTQYTIVRTLHLHLNNVQTIHVSLQFTFYLGLGLHYDQ